MDGAIYHPTRTTFFAVRGGYITEYNQSLVAVNGPVKFAGSIFGRSCIAYDSVNDRIWAGVNGDQAAGYLGDAGGANPAKSTVGLYRIVPSTLALEAFLDPTTLFSVKNFGGSTGIYDVFVANAKLFAAYWSSTGSSGVGNPIGTMLAVNLPAYTAAWSQSAGGPSCQLAHDSVNAPNRIWQGQDDDNFNQFQMQFWHDTDGTGNSSLFSQPTNGAHQAACFCSLNNFMYQVDMPNQQLIKINATTAHIDSYHTLTGVTVGGMTSRIRFNTNDNKIYIPCPATNQVVVYDPTLEGGNPVVKIYGSVDSPHDVVFAPGGINVAIQSGQVGLNLLTT